MLFPHFYPFKLFPVSIETYCPTFLSYFLQSPSPLPSSLSLSFLTYSTAQTQGRILIRPLTSDDENLSLLHPFKEKTQSLINLRNQSYYIKYKIKKHQRCHTQLPWLVSFIVLLNKYLQLCWIEQTTKGPLTLPSISSHSQHQ